VPILILTTRLGGIEQYHPNLHTPKFAKRWLREWRGEKKSYIFPLVRMIIRDLLWKTYEADKFYIDLEEQGKAC
jgi:hypothetical protein